MFGSPARRVLLGAFVTTALTLTACAGAPAAPTAAPKPTEAPKPTTAAAAPAAASPAAVAASPAAAASPATAASPAAGASPAASPSPAAASPTVNGEVDKVDGRTLSVVTNTGVSTVRVADNATVLIEGQGNASDLTAGKFVAITGKPDGTALVVRFFPPGVTPKPSQFPMGGAQTGNIMTNANIDSFDGKTLTVDLGGQKQTITVTPETEVVKPVPSSFSEIKPGVRVIATGTPGADGLTATTVTIVTQPNVVRAP